MRIGVDARELRRGRMTGIGRFLGNLLRALLKRDTENEYFLFGYPDLDLETEAKNLVRVAHERTLTPFWDQVYLASAVKEHKIEVFVSPYYKVPFLAQCRTVLTHHDFTMFVYPEYKKRYLYNLALQALMRIFNSKAKKILCETEFTKGEILRRFDLPGERVSVIAASVGSGFVPCSAERIEGVRKKYGLEKRYLLYVGNASPHKNVEGLTAAYSALPRELLSRYDLVLAGAGAAPGAPDGVRRPGHVADGDLPPLYSGAELFVFPSFYEGFGLPPLEAMACGCPVVSSNAACMPEVLGDAALYFDPADVPAMTARIAEALNSAGIRSALRRKGAERARYYAAKDPAADLLEVLKSA